MTSNTRDGNEYLFELALFLATSARNCIEEPPLYGPFRLLDALSRLTEFPKHASSVVEDEFLNDVKVFVDEKKFLVTTDVEEFKKATDQLVERFAKELKKRYLKSKKEE